MTGDVAVLKCICGNEALHSQTQGQWGDTGISKADQPICSAQFYGNATTGICHIGSIGTDPSADYFYIADGDTTASLYRRITNENGSYLWEKAE